eukprot:Gb_37873 [translate_table: standard]
MRPRSQTIASIIPSCIGGCDEVLRELIEICGTGPRNPLSGSARGRQAVQPTRNNRTGNSRQSACLHCRQPGHSSNECPRQISRPRGPRAANTSGSTGAQEMLCDNCGMPCALRTANTENNRGRRFFTCQSRNCNFFKWEDSVQNAAPGAELHTNPGRNSGEVVVNTRANRTNRTATRGGRSGRNNREGGRADGTFVSATGEPVADRRCFVCGDPSHFANNCSNRGL